MRELSLWFTLGPQVLLTRVSYTASPSSRPLVSVRGRPTTCGAFIGSFQWSSAVRGVAALAIIHSLCDQEEHFSNLERSALSGDAGSLAAALDYSVSKCPAWVTEMFGSDPCGRPTLSRLLIRRNSNRKRPGPVIVQFNPRLLYPTAIIIRDSQGRVLSKESRLSLLQNLRAQDAGGVSPPACPIEGDCTDHTNSGVMKRFSSLVEADAFFSNLHVRLMGDIDPSEYVVGEVAHAWWPLLNFGREVSYANSSPYHRLAYSCRGGTPGDLWVAGAYHSIGVMSKVAASSRLLHDFWVYGDTVVQVYLPEALTSRIDQLFQQGLTNNSIDVIKFTRSVLEYKAAIDVSVQKSPALARSLRHHVMSEVSAAGKRQAH